MTENEIKGWFSKYGQYASGKDYALLNAIEAIVAPQRKPWVGLTDEEINKIRFDWLHYEERAKAIEAKLKEKNDKN